MSIGAALYSALQALAGGRVYPLVAPPDAPAPYIVWQIVSSEPDYHVRGASGLYRTRVQVDAWADTYAAAQSLRDSVVAALRGGATWKLAGEYINPDDIDPESGGFRASNDFILWHE